MSERMMATIRQIDDIQPIPDADAIEVATIGGWKAVVKKNEFRVGQFVVYAEVDSWIPHDIAPFLSKGQEPREYNGVKGERLRTIRLRKQLSQGLVLPLEILAGCTFAIVDGLDVTDMLGIQKWEAPINAQLAGMWRGNFPSAVPKTDQERIQNLKRNLERWVTEDISWEVTEKLEGSSMTVFLDADLEIHVCSRNIDLKGTEGNSFWQMANELDLPNKMKNALLSNIAIQGELIGPGIQGNIYKLTKHKFMVYDIYDVKAGTYLSTLARTRMVKQLGLDHAPILNDSLRLTKDTDIQFLLGYAEDKSMLNPKQEREGVVYKCNEDPLVSFKAISNQYLLSQK